MLNFDFSLVSLFTGAFYGENQINPEEIKPQIEYKKMHDSDSANNFMKPLLNYYDNSSLAQIKEDLLSEDAINRYDLLPTIPSY